LEARTVLRASTVIWKAKNQSRKSPRFETTVQNSSIRFPGVGVTGREKVKSTQKMAVGGGIRKQVSPRSPSHESTTDARGREAKC